MSSTHKFDRTVLREYDIRGIVGKTLSAADARAVGRGFGTVGARAAAASASRSAMTAACRSPELEAARGRGPGRDAASRCCAIGLGPTPMLYFARALARRSTAAS